MASTRLTKTWSSSGNRNKWTWSSWVKRSNISNTNRIFGVYQNNSYSTTCYFNSAGQLLFIDDYNGSSQAFAQTNAKYRDTHGFYHIVVTYDKDNSTSADKLILYVNGERVSLATYVAPSQATTWNVDGLTMEIGAFNSADYFDGYMSHIHFCDGYAYAASDFGSTDNTTGIWKPKTAPSVSYGTNGFFLDFASSSSMGNDISGNNNDWTVAGNLKQCLTTPSNIFCTWNGVGDAGGDHSFNNGGTGVAFQETSGDARVYGNLAFSKGKYYWEWKAISEHPSANTWGIGSVDDLYNQESPGSNNKHWIMNAANKYNGSAISYGSQVNIGEIGMVAVDMDNGKIWFGKDGTWFGSGNPSTGANPAFSNVTDVTVTPIAADNVGSYTPQQHYNFGEGRFGTTAVASAGSNSGLGTFEFDVPTNFKALCTKNINEQEYS
jgi:hypothetical protein